MQGTQRQWGLSAVASQEAQLLSWACSFSTLSLDVGWHPLERLLEIKWGHVGKEPRGCWALSRPSAVLWQLVSKRTNYQNEKFGKLPAWWTHGDLGRVTCTETVWKLWALSLWRKVKFVIPNISLWRENYFEVKARKPWKLKKNFTCFLHVCYPQSCLTLCDPRGPPGSSVHRIFLARILEWVAISYSRGSYRPTDRTCLSCIFCIGR